MPSQIIPFDSDRWEFHARESRVEEHLGQKSLLLRAGHAIVKDSEFTDGIIEYDVAFSQQRRMVGAVWRLKDLENYEKFYMRAHQSGNPDATQYTPIFNGISSWQLYHGEGYGVAIEFPFDRWIHVKIVVSGKQAEVYIDDMETPALFVHDLKREIEPGNVGLEAEPVPPFAPTHFANFSYTAIDNPPLKGTPKAPETAPEGTILSWSISNTFTEASLAGKLRLTDADTEGLTWTKLTAEPTGLVNLARVQGIAGDKNTAFARVTVNADAERFVPLAFGFSDRVNVYLNGQRVYSGNDTFRSRDYRFLGTIGFYDTLYLPLKTGENELLFAVSESGGGWGLQARFAEMAGIEIQ